MAGHSFSSSVRSQNLRTFQMFAHTHALQPLPNWADPKYLRWGEQCGNNTGVCFSVVEENLCKPDHLEQPCAVISMWARVFSANEKVLKCFSKLFQKPTKLNTDELHPITVEYGVFCLCSIVTVGHNETLPCWAPSEFDLEKGGRCLNPAGKTIRL